MLKLDTIEFKADIQLDVDQIKSILKERIERELDVNVVSVSFQVRSVSTDYMDRGSTYQLCGATVSVRPKPKVATRRLSSDELPPLPDGPEPGMGAW